jgi:hypothetical protein
LSGSVGVVRSIRSEVYNVEMPGNEVVSAAESEVSLADGEEIVSGRGKHMDPVRETVREFLLNVPSLTRVPEDILGIKKEILESDHVVYLHTETLPDGKPYTVEFHVDPADNYCDVYVIRDLDNHSLGGDPISIDDIDDWSLGEADEVDARLVNELAHHVRDGESAGEDGFDNEDEFEDEDEDDDGRVANSSFSLWLDRVGKGIFSKMDFQVCEGLRKELAGMGLIESDVGALSLEDMEGGGEQGEEDVLSEVPAGARPFLRRTLDTVDGIVTKPLSAVDALADSLVKGVSGLAGRKSG